MSVSTPPSSASSVFTNSPVAARSARSQRTNRTAPAGAPARADSASSASPLAASISSASTRAPALAKAKVMAVPRPPAAPVSRTFLSRNSMSLILPFDARAHSGDRRSRQILTHENLDAGRLDIGRRLALRVAIGEHPHAIDDFVARILVDDGVQCSTDQEPARRLHQFVADESDFPSLARFLD